MIVELVRRARERLLAGGIPADEAPGDAEVLARHVLGWDLTQYASRGRDAAPADFPSRYDALITRRLAREPVSQIVGHREFWGLDFEVTRDVLTPRPETELVVQAALDLHPPAERPTAAPVIVEVGTGSGCIAVALAKELPHAHLIASDASLAALTVARRNAARHGVSARIALLHSSQIPRGYDVEIVVSNPPYIPLGERASLAPEVRDHEPELALFGGQDGLEVLRALLRNLRGDVSENGRLIVEVGYDQAARVKAIANPRFWAFERAYRDLQGIERVLVFRALRPPDGDFSDEGGWSEP
ncbi:MAG TPA: peptide chain release factor N(5)-glutamine methyltransferase [Vicinamibacterales bacterium]|jgi:release factor glutamine methyltransferase